MNVAVGSISVLIECHDHHGRPLARERLTLVNGTRSFTIGRSTEADITLDDEHVAALHASLTVAEDGTLMAADLGSLNGLIIAGRSHDGTSPVTLPGDTLRLGNTQLRVRTSLAELAPEKPLRKHTDWLARYGLHLVLIGLIAALVEAFYYSWLPAPQDFLAAFMWAIVGQVAAVVCWVSLWALLSRIMLGQWRWLRHTAILLTASLVYLVANEVSELALAVLTPAGPASLDPWLGATITAITLYWHLRQASSLTARPAMALACILPLLVAGGYHWQANRTAARDVNRIDANLRIYPPALRVRSGEPLAGYFARVDTLRDKAITRRDNLPATDTFDDGLFSALQ